MKATPIAIPHCDGLDGRKCGGSPKYKVFLDGYNKLLCPQCLNTASQKRKENIELVKVKYDEAILPLAPIVSRSPEFEGANCWNFRDPEVQRKIERQRDKESEELSEKLDRKKSILSDVASVFDDGVNPIVVFGGISYEIVAGTACLRNNDGSLRAVYLYENGNFLPIKPR
jgi:hypothetical protein